MGTPQPVRTPTQDSSVEAAIALMLISGLAGGSAFALIPHLNHDSAQQARAKGFALDLTSGGADAEDMDFRESA